MPKAIGGSSSGPLHIGRRVQLVIWLQILQEWIGIAGVTICKLCLLVILLTVPSGLIASHLDANNIFGQAGYSGQKARGLAGVNDITYMVITSCFGCLKGG